MSQRKYYCMDCGKPLNGKFFCCFECAEYKARIAGEAELYDDEELEDFHKKEDLAARIVLGAMRGQARAKEIAKEMEEVHAREANMTWHLEPIYGTGLSTFYDGLVIQHMMGVAEEVL